MILDELKQIERLDISKVVKEIENFPEQCEKAIEIGMEFAKGFKIKKPQRVFLSGMGGSGVAGDMLASLFPDKDIRVFKGYELPKYVKRGDLVFSLSYSGNTEETLSIFRDAFSRKCMIVSITSGGELEKQCVKHSLPYVKIPKGMKPRFAFGYIFFPVLAILEKTGFLGKQNMELVIKNLKETREEIGLKRQMSRS